MVLKKKKSWNGLKWVIQMSKGRYGDNFGNVILLKDEYNELVEKYPTNYTEYINRLDVYIEKTGRKYNSHFLTIKEWMAKDEIAEYSGKDLSNIVDPLDDTIMESLRAEYHNVHCKCGKRMEFIDFVEKIEGKVPDGRYKCSCGITAQEKEGKLIYDN